MILCILGRQPELSLAELEQRFGSTSLTPFSPEAALVESDSLAIEQLGGTLKAGRVVAEFPRHDWAKLSNEIVRHYKTAFLKRSGKITLGISVYGHDVAPKAVQLLGIKIKQATKGRDGSLRLVPNETASLSTATSHHNKLGLADNKIELLIAYGKDKVVVAESTGAQNITALAKRDQGRPKRDAFVGMLPPKLALMMINMSGLQPQSGSTTSVLDPFCGTGVVLQEAALLGYKTYGTDLSDKMVAYSKDNMQWLADKYRLSTSVRIEQGDAMAASWEKSIDAVVAEAYLGQPFSAPPSPKKLQEVVRNCDHIISSFLNNIHAQLEPGTPLCLAVPAWRDKNGQLTHLPFTEKLASLGYAYQPLTSVDPHALIYYRSDQVVARQLLVIKKL